MRRPFPLHAVAIGALSLIIGLLSQDPIVQVLRLAAAGVATLMVVNWFVDRGGAAAAPGRRHLVVPAAVLGVLTVPAMVLVRDDSSAMTGHALILAAGFAVLVSDSGRAARSPSLMRDRVYLAIGIAALFGYANFGRFHFGNFMHTWETYHRYVGAKYAPELGPDGLYACTLAADAKAGWIDPVAKVRDLSTGEKVYARSYLPIAEQCAARFSPDRWQSFSMDVAWFRARVTDRRWHEMKEDFGLNESPTWIAVAFVLANVLPPWPMVLLDPLLLLGGAMLALWAFGPRGFAVSSVLLGTNWGLGFFYWEGGSVLSQAWLFLAIASVCLLKRERPGLAGAALAVSAAASGFTALLFAGAAGAALFRWLARRPLAAFGRFFATAVAVGLAAVLAGALLGIDRWTRFADGPLRDVPKTNDVGFFIAVASGPEHSGMKLRDPNAVEPWAAWQQARRSDVAATWVSRWFFALVAVALLLLAIRQSGAELWLAVALSAGLIPLLTVRLNYELTCLVPLGLAAARYRSVAATTFFIAGCGLAVRHGIGAFTPTWLDQQSVWLSWSLVVGLVMCWLLVVLDEENPAPSATPMDTIGTHRLSQ